MSLNLSPGTLDTMAGIFAPAKKQRLGSGGGSPPPAKQGGTMLRLAVASMFPKATSRPGGGRQPYATKQAFGAGAQGAVSRRAIATMDRTARRVPEVLVRITGRQHGSGHVLANFAYISRLGHGTDKQLALYTSDEEVLRDGRAMQELAQDWQEWEMGDDARRKGATSLSMILSMPSGTDPERLKAAALDFAREEFANRSWVASLHIDRDHPHVHLTFARRDHDGRRFHPTRDDLFRYRQRFAQKLRDRGIEANATPAKARGVDPKHEPIAARKVRANGQVPRLDTNRLARAQRFANATTADPVRAILTEQQAVVRDAYLQSIAELSATPSVVNQTVAKSLQRFVEVLPDPEPNSIQAAHTLRVLRALDTRLGGLEAEASDAPADPIAAAIARSSAMRDRIEARRIRDQTDAVRSPEPVDPERQKEETRTPITRHDPATAPTDIDEVMRQVQERERARMARERERDRSPGRGGPTR